MDRRSVVAAGVTDDGPAAAAEGDGRAVLRGGLRQPLRQRSAARVRDQRVEGRTPRTARRGRSVVGELLLERFGRSYLRAGIAAGPRYRDPHRPRDRPAARDRRSAGRPRPHADRVHLRPWRRAGARYADRALAAGWTDDQQGAVRTHRAGVDHALRRRPVADGYGGLVAVSELCP